MEQPTIPTITKQSIFPSKLHFILSNQKYSHIVSWLSHGRSWRINDPKEFQNIIIPKFFRHRNLSSFMRQVNGWGFHRVTRTHDHNSYYHEKFLRGMPSLCKQMKRRTRKEYIAKHDPETAPAPDFYEMSKKNPLPDEIHSKQSLGTNSNQADEVPLHHSAQIRGMHHARPEDLQKYQLIHPLQLNSFPTLLSNSQNLIHPGAPIVQAEYNNHPQLPGIIPSNHNQDYNSCTSMITDMHIHLLNLQRQVDEIEKKRKMWIIK